VLVVKLQLHNQVLEEELQEVPEVEAELVLPLREVQLLNPLNQQIQELMDLDLLEE
jgi:hypothetical protein